MLNDTYDPANWYWQIGEDTSQLWSSADASFVPARASVTYTVIKSLDELKEVLLAAGLPAAAGALPIPASPEEVKEECARRIFAACSATAQSNINGYINLLNAKALGGGTLSQAERDDIVMFGRAMTWINDMRATCPGLVGSTDCQAAENWPPLPPDIAAFAARF
jgi:hypothetical protein